MADENFLAGGVDGFEGQTVKAVDGLTPSDLRGIRLTRRRLLLVMRTIAATEVAWAMGSSVGIRGVRGICRKSDCPLLVGP